VSLTSQRSLTITLAATATDSLADIDVTAQELRAVLLELLAMSQAGERRVRLVVNLRMALGQGLGGAPQILLGGLPAADAQQLLLMHSGKGVQLEQAEELAEGCGGNPLALTLVGGLLASQRCTPQVRCH
jgi:hypothetical protein